MIYEGMANSLFLVEGTADSVFNDYIKNNKKQIASAFVKELFTRKHPEKLAIVADKTIIKGKEIEMPYTSFKGTSSDKGGLSKITNYNQKCIDEKIE